MAIVSMKELLEAGVHFGHRRRRWNPKMKSFIFTERNGIHIIDLQQTLSGLTTAYNLVRETVADGGNVLFVGTKRQAQEAVAEEAERCLMPYVNNRWLGGTLTNFVTIRQRIDYMIDLEERFETGEIQRLSKKEVLTFQRELDRLHRRFGGLRRLTRLPDIVFVIDVKREEIAVRESNILEVPVIAMVDTNCDPDPIDYIIPSNDDAIRAIRLITSKMADAVNEGLAMRSALAAEREAEAEEEEAEAIAEVAGGFRTEDEKYLGEATLAKLRSGLFADKDEETELDEEDEETLETELEAEEIPEPIDEEPEEVVQATRKPKGRKAEAEEEERPEAEDEEPEDESEDE